MTYLLKVDINNVHIRTVRAKYIDELIDLLFMQASAFQQENGRDGPHNHQTYLATNNFGWTRGEASQMRLSNRSVRKTTGK